MPRTGLAVEVSDGTLPDVLPATWTKTRASEPVLGLIVPTPLLTRGSEFIHRRFRVIG